MWSLSLLPALLFCLVSAQNVTPGAKAAIDRVTRIYDKFLISGNKNELEALREVMSEPTPFAGTACECIGPVNNSRVVSIWEPQSTIYESQLPLGVMVQLGTSRIFDAGEPWTMEPYGDDEEKIQTTWKLHQEPKDTLCKVKWIFMKDHIKWLSNPKINYFVMSCNVCKPEDFTNCRH